MFTEALATGSSSGGRVNESPPALDTASIIDWLAQLPSLPQSDAVEQMLLQLDQLSRAELSPRNHIEVMRLLRRPMLKLAASLPRPDPRLPNGGLATTQAIAAEQRLDHGMQIAFNRLLAQLDRHRYRDRAASAANRHWAMRQQMKFTRRQARYGLLARRACIRGTWQDVHDLFVYMVIRGHVVVQTTAQAGELVEDFDPYLEYRRLLLLGRAAQLDLPADVIPILLTRLETWARESVLVEPEGCRGTSNLLLVELSRDRPLRCEPATLIDGFRGWVLRPAEGFSAFCQPFADAARHKVCA